MSLIPDQSAFFIEQMLVNIKEAKSKTTNKKKDQQVHPLKTALLILISAHCFK